MSADPPFEIRFQVEAAADLRALEPDIRQRIREKLNWLAVHAEEVRHEGLSGELAGLCKRRVGGYRILYQPLPRKQIIVVHRIAHRREVYGDR